MFLKVFFLFVFVIVSDAQYDGDRCIKDGVAGVCRNVNRCQSALDDIKNRKTPQTCSFNNTDPIVCCLDAAAPNPVATTTRRPYVSSTTEYIPPVYDYENVVPNDGQCEPIPTSLTTNKTGQKALDKCIEYQEKYVYPCEAVTLTGGLSRSNRCHHNADELIIGGIDAAQFEFPHMVMVGYGEKIEDVQYQCSGAILSERFILIAGHCIKSRVLGPITYIAAGVLLRSNSSDRSRVYKVKNVIKHPEFKPPVKYNDIALVETEKPIALDQFVVPACLPTGDPAEGSDAKVLATDWGLPKYSVGFSNTMQKVVLQKLSTSECMQKFMPTRLIRDGFNAQSQTCYGDKDTSKDTCQGARGGLIQIKNKKIQCTYIVVGVSSFGKYCGFQGQHGLYTRVINYVPWIESVVWPN